MSRSRSLDHLLSLIAGFAGGLAVWAIRNWVIKQQSKNKKNNNGKNYPYGKSNNSTTNDSDADIDLVVHNGACHCKRVKFRIKASRLLQAVDIPSKIRFPRGTVPHAHESQIPSSSLNGRVEDSGIAIEGLRWRMPLKHVQNRPQP